VQLPGAGAAKTAEPASEWLLQQSISPHAAQIG
jgi:hypothetical protein